MLLPPYQGRGIMQEALRQVTAMNTKAFYVAYVKSDNSASLRLFKQADFWRVPKKRRKKRA
jgi:RimJ/RimL family protein N-acetyltransferase